MRKRLLAGNWKMNMTSTDLKKYSPTFTRAAGLTGEGNSPVEILFAVGYTLLEHAKREFEQFRIAVAAQNIHWDNSGAYTGEVSIHQLRNLGIGASLIGHSERRQFFGETDESVNKKVLAANEAHFWPIVCVGETLEEREAGKTEQVITTQVSQAFSGLADPKNLVLAYEPVWAIGTGKSATTEEAQEVHYLIRKLVGDLFKDTSAANEMRILYGGSAKPANIGDLIAQEDIDGALVGGASLNPDQFAEMVQIMSG